MYQFVMFCGLVTVLMTPADAVVGGQKAAAPEPDAAVVFLQKNGRSARLEGIRNDKLGYYLFMGIRYAEPPVGRLRFQRPVRRFLAGEMNVTSNCYPCPQPDPYKAGSVIGNEDCLCINVFAPKMPGEETGCPVIFYIHGGNYRSGSAAPYGGQHLTQKDTILVTAQYRLGSLGYLSTGQKDASGNVGLFDLQAAVKWVTDYIEFFGGDPKRVVIMGHGSGGSAASLLALSDDSPAARGVAALSGAPLSPGAVRADRDPAKHAEQLATRTNCPPSPAESLVACLRTRSIADIVEADRHMTMELVDTEAFLTEMSGRSGQGVRVEGSDDFRGLPPLVTDQPAKSIYKKKKLCPMLTGVTSAETSRAIFGKYSKFLAGKLDKVKDFIKKDIIGGLRGVVDAVPSLIEALPPEVTPPPLADFYQVIFASTRNIVDGLTQIAEATNDALFNFPAYQSTRAWSQNGNAYLYSFEHVGNLSKGSHFLPGLVLTEDDKAIGSVQPKVKGPSHGDELAYIFEPLNEDGLPLDERISDTDVRVRESFVSLLAKFAHELSPLEPLSNNTTLLQLIPFSKENDPFIKINSGGVSLDKNFRFCQMGLWGNMVSRLSTPLCKSNILKLPINIPLGQGQGNSGLPIDLSFGQSQGYPGQPSNLLSEQGLVSPQPGSIISGGLLRPLGQGSSSNGGIFGSKVTESSKGTRSPFGFLNKL